MNARLFFKRLTPGNWAMVVFEEAGVSVPRNDTTPQIRMDGLTLETVEALIKDFTAAYHVSLYHEEQHDMVLDIMTDRQVTLNYLRDLAYSIHGREIEDIKFLIHNDITTREPMIRYIMKIAYPDDIPF